MKPARIGPLSGLPVIDMMLGQNDTDPNDYDDDEDDHNQLHLKVDRGALVAALEAGLSAGAIVLNEHFLVRLVADRFEIGSRKFKAKRHVPH